MKTLLYIHGLGSGQDSRTSKYLKKYLKDQYNIIAPEIPFEPFTAISFLTSLNQNLRPSLIVGSSLGGFYAALLGGAPKLLINPALLPDIDLQNAFGCGKFSYHSERSDKSTEFEITPGYIKDLYKISKNFYDKNFDEEFREETYAIFGIKDTLIDEKIFYKKIYSSVEPHFVTGNFEHRLKESDIIEYVVPLIERIEKDDKSWIKGDCHGNETI